MHADAIALIDGARFKIDTGAVHFGVTMNYPPDLIVDVIGDLEKAAAALRAMTADAGAQPQDGNRPLPIDRETLGRMVREAWVRWAETQPAPKPSWLVPYDELAEPDKEADRQIGEAISRWTLIHDAARNSLTADAGAQGEAVPSGVLAYIAEAEAWYREHAANAGQNTTQRSISEAKADAVADIARGIKERLAAPPTDPVNECDACGGTGQIWGTDCGRCQADDLVREAARVLLAWDGLQDLILAGIEDRHDLDASLDEYAEGAVEQLRRFASMEDGQ